MRTLLLNATYEPLRVLSLKRAVVLVLQEKAEVIEEGDAFVRSANTAMKIPKVIRLKYFVQVPYKARIPINRKTIMARDNAECQFTHCNRKGTTIDHVQPRSRGGKHEWENVVAACPKCNAKKADSTMSEIGWELKRKPFAPRGRIWILLGLQAENVPEWKPYLESLPT